LVVLATACGPVSQPLPPIPEIDLSGFAPYSRRQIEEAIGAVRESPQDPERVGRLGMILHAYRNAELAAPLYERARRLAPKEFRWAYYHGAALSAASGPEESIAAFREALALDPGYERARVRLADELVAAGELEAARELCLDMLESAPNSPGVLYRLGQVHVRERNTPAAIEAFERSLRVGGSFGAGHYALAKAYSRAGRTAEAERQFELQKRHSNRQLPVHDPLIAEVQELELSTSRYIRRAKRRAVAGNIWGAIEDMKAALELEPGAANLHSNLVLFYGQAGAYHYAERHYEAALVFDPNLALLHFNMGIVRERQRRYAEAASLFRRAIELDERLAHGYLQLARVLGQQGQTGEAERNYRRAIEVDASLRAARHELGGLCVGEGRYTEAVEQFRLALTPEDRQTSIYLFALADAQRKLGDEEAAAEAEKRAEELVKKYGRPRTVRTGETGVRREVGGV
jgi:tetratricopeptide (TPR) repeat protein